MAPPSHFGESLFRGVWGNVVAVVFIVYCDDRDADRNIRHIILSPENVLEPKQFVP